MYRKNMSSGLKHGGNVLQLPEGGDFDALHCQPSTNFDRCTKLDLTTEPPLLGRCCCAFVLLSSTKVVVLLTRKYQLKGLTFLVG